MELDILDRSVIHKLVSDIESSENRQRRMDEIKAFKCSEGGQIEYIKKELSTLFPESWYTMRVSDISLTKKVLDKLAAYKQKPIRKLSDSLITEEYNELLEIADAQSSFQEFDRDFNRQKYALMWVKSFGEGKYKLESLKGFESFVVIDKNTGELIAVCLNYPDNSLSATGFGYNDGQNQWISESQDDSSMGGKVYVFWTKEQHTIWRVDKDDRGNFSRIDMIVDHDNPSGINPIGMLPFVWRSKNQSGDLPYLNNITSQSITANVLMSDLLTASSNQGHGQLVMKMPPDIKMKKVHTGQATAINLPIIDGVDAQPSAEYINANPDLGGMTQVVYDYISAIFNEHGLSSESVKGETKNFTSGIERLISQADAQGMIRQNQSIYSSVEKDIFEIIAAYESLDGNPRFMDEEISVYFEKPKVMITDSEVLANIEKRLQLGLITKVEALQMLDPNLTDEQAEEKLELIQSEKMANMESFLGGGQNNQENEVVDEEDQRGSEI